MTYRIYGADLSPYLQRVTIQCDYKGLAYEGLPAPGGLHSDEFRALNPIGKIPALQLEDCVLPESEVICEYLEDRHPERSLRPFGAEARAKTRLIARVVDLYLMAPMNPLFGQLRRSTRDESVSAQRLPACYAVSTYSMESWTGPSLQARRCPLPIAQRRRRSATRSSICRCSTLNR